MKKFAILFVLILSFFLVGNVEVLAGTKSTSINKIVGDLVKKVTDLRIRVDRLEANQFTPVYYTKDVGGFHATANTPITVLFGCDEGDVAIAGGLISYQGRIENWKTLRSVPLDSEYNNHAWEATVINEVEDGGFTLRVKCLDLTR